MSGIHVIGWQVWQSREGKEKALSKTYTVRGAAETFMDLCRSQGNQDVYVKDIYKVEKMVGGKR